MLNEIILTLLAAGIGYLLGSIPFGLIFSHLAGVDLRSVGSGNIGATNVLRTGKKFIAFLTLLFDVLKAVAAVLVTQNLIDASSADSYTTYYLISAVGAFLGHCFPVWLKFNGGKGVATYFGLLMILSLPVFFVCAIGWLATFAITRVSSVSSITIAVLAPATTLLIIFYPTAFLVSGYEHFYVQLILSSILIWRHRQNIVRLCNGTEPKFGSTA